MVVNGVAGAGGHDAGDSLIVTVFGPGLTSFRLSVSQERATKMRVAASGTVELCKRFYYYTLHRRLTSLGTV